MSNEEDMSAGSGQLQGANKGGVRRREKGCVCVCVCVVVVGEIITWYQVQTGRFLATTGYVAPSPNHVQHNVQVSKFTTVFLSINKNPAPWLRTPEPPRQRNQRKENEIQGGKNQDPL